VQAGTASYGRARGLEGYEAIHDAGSEANTGGSEAPGGKHGTGTVHEQRDAAVHSPKQPIKAVEKPSVVAAAAVAAGSSSDSDSDPDNIVELTIGNCPTLDKPDLNLGALLHIAIAATAPPAHCGHSAA
jgi:hypothetical protein